ncbi:MAG: hypothetical protein WBH31_09145 [Promethearchaeia archaeon]
MSLKYSDYLKNKKNDKKYNESRFEDEGDNSDYLDIWTVNPFYKDINTKKLRAKIGFFAILILATSFLILSLFSKINYLIGAIAFLLVLLFYENIFNFFNNLFTSVQGLKWINPYKDLIFWTNDPETLVMVNKKNSLVFAIQIFEVKTLPENVHPTLNHFLKALNNANIKYSYQVVQTPLMYQKLKIKKISNNETSIYFSVFDQRKGILTKSKIDNLVQTVRFNSKIFKSHLSSNFHHTQISLLSGLNLINAIRAIFCGINLDKIEFRDLNNEHSKNNVRYIVKLIVIALFIGLVSYFSTYFSLPWIFILLLDIIIIMALIFIWWEDLLYSISRVCFLNNINVKSVDPFIDINFYRMKGCRDTLFLLLDDHLLIGLKQFSLKHAIQKCFIYSEKLFRELNNQKITFIYTLQAIPLLPSDFSKKCSKFLNEKGYSDMKRIFGETVLGGTSTPPAKNAPLVFKNWLNMRSGIWNTILTVSVLSYHFINPRDISHFEDVEEDLISKSEIMLRAFEDNFLNLKLTQLRNHKLINGYRFVSLKNSLFKAKNTGLPCVYFQGKTLIYLNAISNEFKKGLETKIAAEFNTPLHLKNDIIIGETINTEFLEKEGELGFKLEQVKQLLITNGLSEQREHTMMKIVTELIKIGIPCVIFDYSGKWSKLISNFKNTYLEETFLYFKLGRSFSLYLIDSEEDYDKHNLEYLNLFYDVFALAFKEQRKSVDLLKESVTKNKEIDISTLALEHEMEEQLFKKNNYNSLLELLQGFIDWRALFSSRSLKFEQEIKPIDFLKIDKTIIIDLSLLEELKQKNFSTFVLLSKFIHHLRNVNDFHRKVIIIPHIDLFFDAYYIDNYNMVDYGTIEKFLDPFLDNGFGLICSANQIRYLHSHVFTYFPNIITFKATDPRDIAVLKNTINLQELQGTGYYSSKRNNTYQIDYLMNLRKNEVIVKRSDINQPFPGEINYDQLQLTPLLSQDTIAVYMERQGYAYKDHERRILERAKETLFEKDFGIYSEFIDDIIKFLANISAVDKIGGNYEHKLKEELLKYIHSNAIHKTKDKKKIKQLRDALFRILKQQSYLVESHPLQASGGQTTRTCYKVGQKYHNALKDYYSSKKRLAPNISVDVIEKNIKNNSKGLNMLKGVSSNDTIRSDKFKDIVFRELGSFIWQLFKLHDANENKHYETSLKVGKDLIFNYLTSLYKIFLKMNGGQTPESIKLPSFITALTSYKVIPFTMNMIKDYCQKSKQLSQNAENPEKNAHELEDLIMEFYKTTRMHFITN